MKQPELGRKIAELRKQLGYTQEDLALESGFNVRTIQRIENGDVEPRPKNLKILADILGFDLNSIPAESNIGWFIILHLSSFFPTVILPVALWIWKRDEIHGFDKHCRDVINFQLSMFIFLMIAGITVLLVVGLFAAVALGFYIQIITIINVVKVAAGSDYRYPLSMEFIK